MLGNHDHWEGADECRRTLRRAGVHLIEQGSLFATLERLVPEEVRGRSVALCGVGDLWEGVCEPEAPLRGVSDGCPRVLVSHNPDVAEIFARELPMKRFDVQLSGHTHGGQVRLPGLGTPVVPSRFGAKYAGGLVQGPAWPVIVSRGVGLAIAPVRLGVPPEVVAVALRSA